MWLTAVLLCLTYFGAGIAIDLVPPPLAAHIVAWRDKTALEASCRLAFLTSHSDPASTEIG